MYEWMLSLKTPNGSFAMHQDGDIDVRGCATALSVATVLNLLTPELVKNLPEYLVSCQTYEGGICADSFFNSMAKPEGTQPEYPNAAPTGEAHGGYSMCALTCDFLLQGLPSLSGSPRLDYDSCLRWAAHMQGLPIEGGGFRGRTNKLVDGCYGWWCGSALTLLQALMSTDLSTGLSPKSFYEQGCSDLLDRQALQEYILLISQDLTPNAKKGGLRDKPCTPPDLYHTYYILGALSIMQHTQKHSFQRIQELKQNFKRPHYSKCIIGDSESESDAFQRMKEIYSRVLGWEVQKGFDHKILTKDYIPTPAEIGTCASNFQH
ncbi:uncharacterized protein PGTG_15594 [Puccinia graminis f. sp. tritici CRL 75-36-700-3]|uniref:Prenyltransferase alpha-alpha toroid domain-containing protein n=1 Tax=Puccinia graminis f. sp. tritici (strain CRL 75-36-700-3 / race SCCL) TaxID=418459 RepID=E3KZA6_PUCGT|nr:uncharacterized protein PGTG_15594 [Puccinia graminis f. sp. tritici CRL 75-36-700-3]EFP89631.2 hypothetical protein PGTG_15594 [Puccinia graminis f. sp. tritici CRL 75-36-700-3]